MEQVENNREMLYDLSNNWNKLSLLSQLGDASVNMSEIKENFTMLSSKLIDHLSLELLNKNIGEMNFKAQVAVDIVIRNLYERSADIGFLATDNDIRNFLIQNPTKYTSTYMSELSKIKERFAEYINKYSVYFDIVLMNVNGEILANLDNNSRISKSHDSLVKEVLSTNKDFVETYKYHDFLPDHKKSLIYSYKVTTSNEHNSEILGVLCLCFKFHDEMEGIFENLISKKKKEAIMLLDHEGKVIATSDEYQIPLDAKLELIVDEKYKIVTFAGRDYIAKSKKTNGYQNYYGLGWYGHIMIPIEHAFNEEQTGSFEISEKLLLSILQNGERFSDSLKSIPIQANNIQKNLNRTIWNGTIKHTNAQNQNKQFSKALMQEIRQTGESTKSIIGSSIANLTNTIILGDSVFYADLIVDIMDRNLYERANDCRWWALTSEFKKILQDGHITSTDTQRMCEILKYINDLYTVYTNLFIYDKNGIIVAVSNEQENNNLGTKLTAAWVQETLQLSDSSKYCVSPFTHTPLYHNEHTYIYNAAIRTQDNSTVLGGIGIVFDAKEQFSNMIAEALPKKSDGSLKDGVFATIATKEMIIIASSYEKHTVGTHLDIDHSYFSLKPGESRSEIIIYEDKYYALGVKCSKGYREYKSEEDDYINDIYTLFFSYISDISDSITEEINGFSVQDEIIFETGAQTKDVATFMIGNQWLGIDATQVVEAMSVSELKSTVNIDPNHHFKGTLIYEDRAVMVIDIKKFLQEDVQDNYQEIVIIKYGTTPQHYLGIFVNTLEYIPAIAVQNIKSLHNEIIGDGTLIESIVFPQNQSSSKDVLSILCVDKIISELVKPEQSRMIHKQIKL
jgi:chemotaxis signal transduction protein